MNQDEFKSKVEEYAHVKIIKPVIKNFNPGDHVRVTYEGKDLIFDKTFNPSLGFTILRLKDQVKLCRLNCGLSVVNQKIQFKLKKDVDNNNHWWSICNSCSAKRVISSKDLD